MLTYIYMSILSFSSSDLRSIMENSAIVVTGLGGLIAAFQSQRKTAAKKRLKNRPKITPENIIISDDDLDELNARR